MGNARAKTKQEKMLQAAVSLGNMQRCFYSALLFAGSTPLLLLLFSLGIPKEALQPFVIPAVFFAVFMAASACFLFHVIKRRAKRYFSAVSSAYVAFLIIYLCCLARLSYGQSGSLFLYYASVIIGAYVIHTSFPQYAMLCVLELFGLFFVISGGKTAEPAAEAGVVFTGIGMESLAAVVAVSLFAFFLSRESYQARCRAVSVCQKPREEAAEAEKDFMTGLLNRRGLEHTVQSVWGGYVQQEALVAAMLINIDELRQYNKAYGHVEGDLCVCRVAHSIAETVKGRAVAARMDGGNFFVLARGRSEEELLSLAEAIRFQVEELGSLYGAAVTVGIGIEIEKADEDTAFLGLYKRADNLLSLAKRQGKNRIESNYLRGEKYHKIG